MGGIVVEFLWCYSYLFLMLDNYDVIREYLIDGGRKAAKTTQAFKIAITLALSKKRVNLLFVRKLNDDAASSRGTIGLVLNILNKFGVEYKHFKNQQRVILANGNFIDYTGIVSKDGQPKLSGFGSENDPEYIITVVDEAYQLSKKEWYGVYEGVRGLGTKVIFIRLSNNWKAVNWYVRLLNALLPFKFKKLWKHGEQFKIDGDKFIHHSNALLNHFLPKDEIEKLVSTYVDDEERGKVSLIGMPGTLEGAVYNDDNALYTREKPQEWGDPHEVAIGIQLSKKRSIIGATIIGYYNEFKHIGIIDEFSISPDFGDTFINESKRNQLLIEKIQEWFSKYSIKEYDAWTNEWDLEELTIAVSSDETRENLSSFGLHLDSLLEKNTKVNIYESISFTLPIKYTDEEKIDIVKNMMSSGNFIISPQAERTLQQIDAASYGEDNKTKRDVEGYDELIKAIENAMTLRRTSLMK